jgi:hypothetical protein
MHSSPDDSTNYHQIGYSVHYDTSLGNTPKLPPIPDYHWPRLPFATSLVLEPTVFLTFPQPYYGNCLFGFRREYNRSMTPRRQALGVRSASTQTSFSNDGPSPLSTDCFHPARMSEDSHAQSRSSYVPASGAPIPDSGSGSHFGFTNLNNQSDSRASEVKKSTYQVLGRKGTSA